ncbi:MAG TPA: YsnF/AvaK domain-containing protein [Devosia sp.]|jgi:uncharacterized protein (TIGR02271 family)|nr:YsnF/AvaK domain-containing protein [Devosia sp.]
MSQINQDDYRTITAFFDSKNEADRAIERLVGAGISRSDIKLTAGNSGAAQQSEQKKKGFFESLADLFIPDEDRYAYAEGLNRGGLLLAIHDFDPTLHDTVADILEEEGAVNLDEREVTWRAEGWGGFAAASKAGYAATTGTDKAIPVVEEQLKIGKRDVNVGRVRVRSYLREQPVSANVKLHEERVKVERRPVDRPLTAADADAFRNRTIEAEEHAEQAVVGKEARVTEEVSLRREGRERTETVEDTVRKTEVEVEDERTTGAGQRRNQR